MTVRKLAKNTNDRRCAIFQLEGVHEEIIPSIVYALNCNGYRPCIYVNARCKTNRGDIFSNIDKLDFDLYYFNVENRKDWEPLTQAARCPDIEFICLATFQSDGIAQWADRTGKPIIGVVHNANLFLASEHCRAVFASGKLQVLTLAHHVAVFLHQRIEKSLIDRVGVMEPVFWGRNFGRDETSSIKKEDKIVAIPGGVNFQTREYRQLIETLENTDLRQRLDGMVFKVLGGGSDRTILEKEVTERHLSSCIQFAPLSLSGKVLYDNYIAALSNATFLHPLLPLSFYHYREHKITSAIPTAIGFNLPIVLDRWTACTYRIPALVSDATIVASVICLIETEKEQIAATRQLLATYYSNSLVESVKQVKRLIDALK